MTGKPNPRPGGRSARVQASVHKATKELLGRLDRAEITVPLIAARAGVTPSTIYRRWGDLQELLADIAVERLRPDMEPADTGLGWNDLQSWAEQYAEEMSSGPGREMIRDVLCVQDPGSACRCWNYTRQQIEVIAKRALARGEVFPDIEAVMDQLVSPIICRILFDRAPDATLIGALVGHVMRRPSDTP